jgi:Flp pilus assembly protein CpaB
MRRGAFTALVTLLFAAAAAAGVYLFMKNVREEAAAPEATIEVLVSTQDVPANTELDPLIEAGVFVPKTIDQADAVTGVITDLYQLRGQRSAYPILAGEQIPAARLAGPLQAAGGILGIPSGYQAASITLEPQRSVAGNIRSGDRVQVFGTFQSKQGVDTTRVVIPEALVLDVGPRTGSGTVTLAVTPVEASLLIFAQEQGRVWLTLLPPNEPGVQVPPVSVKALQ